MTSALLLQVDGKIPNIALMRIAAHHREQGHEVELQRVGSHYQQSMFSKPDIVYASLIFDRSKPIAEQILKEHPDAIIGGTGWKMEKTLESVGIETRQQDYSIYPKFDKSIGFSQRGCRLRCPFCVVPKKEGAIVENKTIAEIWRGEGYPKEIILLDNDFFGQPNWQQRIDEIRTGGFKVSFNQGINCRMIGDAEAEAIASVDYRDDSMKTKRIYTAWDNAKDEQRLFRGLELLVENGVKPAHIMVYMLIGYWKGETAEDREYRRAKLRDFGAMPYPMPYVRTKELVGFQRWIVGAYDKRITWDDWQQANYRPEKLSQGAPDE